MAFDITTLDLRRLANIAFLDGSAAAFVTNTTGKRTVVKSIILHNTHSAALDVTLYNVPASGGSVGTAAAANQFFKESIAANATRQLEFYQGIVLEDLNDTIQGLCGTAGKVTRMASGNIYTV